MPVAYFHCECGKEIREIVPISRDRMVYSERRRRWEFDPTKKEKIAEMYPNTTTCECGKEVKQSLDPKAVPSKFLFQYMADD